MKNKRFTRIASLLVAISLLVCAVAGLAVAARAEDNSNLKIGYVNLYVYDTFSLVFTVDGTPVNEGEVGIAVYDGAGYDANTFDPAAATAVYTTTETISMGETLFYMTQEIAANYMSHPFVIVPISVDENGDVLEYGEEKLWSVTKYAGKKLYEADEANSDEDDTNDVSEVKIKFYNALLKYAAAADTLLDGEGDTRLYFAWNNLEQQAGSEIVAAMKVLYKNYDSSVITWLANLYDVENGGFYFSNSARDGEGRDDSEGNYVKYLPNLESTSQAMSILKGTGATSNAYTAIPDWMQKQLLDFVRKMQSADDGYFYHPQWGTDITPTKASRDLSHAEGILNGLGKKPYYDTPYGKLKGEGAPAQTAALTAPLWLDAETQVANVVLCASTEDSSSIVKNYPQLESLGTFKTYLNDLQEGENLSGQNAWYNKYDRYYSLGYDSYHVGDILGNMAKTVINRDKELGLTGDGTLMAALLEFLEFNQTDEGHWQEEMDRDGDGINETTKFYAISGVLKILNVYAAAGVAIPNANDLATYILGASDDLASATLITELYNFWGSLEKVIVNVGDYSDEAAANKLCASVREIAPEAIKDTAAALANFKTDGAFSYYSENNPSTERGTQGGEIVSDVYDSEGHPLWEADVNATMLATYGLVERILGSMGLYNSNKGIDYKVPIYGAEDMTDFLTIIKERYAASSSAQ